MIASTMHAPSFAAAPLPLRICYIDNTPSRAERVQRALSRFGHDVKGFQRPDEAMKALSSGNYDLLLVGPIGAVANTLITAVRRSQALAVQTLPVVVLCPTTAMDKRADLMNLGANKVLPTTVNPEALNQQLRDLFVADHVPEGAGLTGQLHVCFLEYSPAPDHHLQSLLLAEGNQVDSFHSLADVLHAVSDHHYDVIVVSERHSHGSAAQRAVRKLREALETAHARAPMLLLTTNPSPANVAALFTAGADDVRAQPVYFDLNKHLHDLVIEVGAAAKLRVQQEVGERRVPQVKHGRRQEPAAPPRVVAPGVDEFARTGAAQGFGALPPQPEKPKFDHRPLQFPLPHEPESPRGHVTSPLPFGEHAPHQAATPTQPHAPLMAPAPGHGEHNHGGHGKPADPFQATHDPLRGFFEKLKAAADRFHGAA